MSEPVIIGDAVLYKGDCLEILPTLEAGSVNAVVTDSPYGLGFMGKDWDHGLPGEHFWREVLRVAKPGAYLLAFGGTRTFHRLGCAIEDAGWEIRDCVMWVYGSGFPKSLDVSKAIDKAAGMERKTVGQHASYRPNTAAHGNTKYAGELHTSGRITAPATDAAKQWAGWGTALKPAWEPIIVARKPLDGTVAANVQKHGTGGLNIDGCRVCIEAGDDIAAKNPHTDGTIGARGIYGEGKPTRYQLPSGRWPANVVHDGSEEVVGLFPQTGVSAGGRCRKPGSSPFGHERVAGDAGFGDSGSAARFFYCAKASKKDRDEGLEAVAPSALPLTHGKRCAVCGKWDRPNCQCECESPQWEEVKPRRNAHPTVKPTALMRWLVRLVTPPGGIVLDPFMGSGSTGKACAKEGFRFLGIELDADYFGIACRRIEDAMTGGPLLAQGGTR